jgi:hypothetical protein
VTDAARRWLEALEPDLADEPDGPDPGPQLAYVAGQAVHMDPELLRAARRRAMLVLAAGGDPHRSLRLDDRAVTLLAAELDSPALRTQLAEALSGLRRLAEGLPGAIVAIDELLDDSELAWRSFACALLAEEIAEE